MLETEFLTTQPVVEAHVHELLFSADIAPVLRIMLLALDDGRSDGDDTGDNGCDLEQEIPALGPE